MFVSRLSIMMALNTRESRVVSGCDSFNSLANQSEPAFWVLRQFCVSSPNGCRPRKTGPSSDSFNSLNPPPAENFVTPQNGNLHSGRTTIHLVPEAACSAINWRAKTRLPQRHTRFSRP